MRRLASRIVLILLLGVSGPASAQRGPAADEVIERFLVLLTGEPDE